MIMIALSHLRPLYTRQSEATTCPDIMQSFVGIGQKGAVYFTSVVVATEINQSTASSSASRRIVRPPSNLVSGQEFTVWSMV